MATVEKPPTRVRNVAEASRRVLDPLQRLRGYIRLYVGLEAAAIVLIYIFACSWLSLLFDYGAFKLPWGLSIDWVQELPRWLRATLLLGFFYGVLLIVAATAINRLMQRFRDTALAIELERRFPRILGDRLITAVELANRKKVVEQGYSQAMVDETIVEAAQRVEKLPIKEVFRWGRLWFMGAMVVVLSVVMYFVVAAGYATTNYFVSRQSVATSFGDYNEILSTWFERNVLLENTIWPRKSYLVVLSPENPDMSVGRDVTPPTLRVLAWEYVVADQHAKNREGWRLLTWNDLVTKKELLGNSPAAVAPEDWKNVRDANVGLTVDEVKLYFNKFDVRKGENPTAEDDKTVYTLADGQQVPFKWATPGKADEGGPQGWRPLTWKELTGDKLQMTNAVPPLPSGWAPPLTPSIGYTIDEVEEANKANPNPDINNVLAQLERLNDMRKTLDHLDTRLADSSMRRKVRKLIVPAKVTVTIRGREATFTMDLDKNADNEFTGEFNKEKLKEKNLKDTWAFKYYATGEDYSTATRKLTIVPPPTLQELFREDEQPAYLFYRYGNPSNATAADIKGKRQPLQRRTVSVTGGDVVVDCPAGTNVTLIGTSDKDLASVELVPNESGDAVPPVTLDKPREFHVALSNVRQKRDYVLKMIDTSGVSGKRPIHITVKRDEEPSVDVDVADWVRRNKSELMVTARARIPFAGNIKDDNGLLRINYAFTVAKLESTAVLDVKAINAATNVLGQMLPGTSGPLQGALYLERALDDIEKTKAGAGGPEGKEVKYFPGKNESISRFEQELKDVVAHPGEFLPRSEIEKNLAERKAAGFRTLFSDLKKFEPDPMTYELAPDPFRGDFNVAEAMKAHLTAGSVQPRFRMTLWVEATDTDLDSTRAVDGQDGPKTASSKVRYQIVIVPEDELQAEIAKDESEMATTMSGALEKLKEVQRKLSGEIRGDLAKKRDAVKPEDRLAPENLGPLAIRTAALEEAIGQSQASAKEVLMKYQALFKELKGNDIQGNKIKTVLEEIIEPLDNLDRTKFIDVREKMQALHSDLTSKDKFEDLVVRAQMDAQAADEQLQKVIEILEMVKGKMEKEIELNKLVQRLRDELQRLQRSKEVIEIIRLWKLKKLDEGS